MPVEIDSTPVEVPVEVPVKVTKAETLIKTPEPAPVALSETEEQRIAREEFQKWWRREQM